MSLDLQLVSVLDPTVQLDEFAIADDKDMNGEAQMGKREKYQGDFVPSVMIKGYQFNHREILSMEIDESGFLPRLKVQLLDRTGSITSGFFPRAKPIISIYIRSRNDKLKVIRNDYLITSIRSTQSDNHTLASDGAGATLSVVGVLYVPQLFVSEVVSVSKSTSYLALFELAKKYKLGFATNEETTNDKMSWLSPFVKGINFIKHITRHAYKNDDTFYMSFIDKYYHLTFVNAASMLSQTMEFTTMFANLASTADYMKDDTNVNEQTDNSGHDLALSNLLAIKGSDTYIQAYKVTTTQGSDLLERGYEKVLHYYDHMADGTDLKKKFISLFLQPYKGSVAPIDPTLRKTSDDEWLGVDYKNTHPHYLFSEIINEHFTYEIAKTKLYVKTLGVNLNILRGQRIPVLIVKEGVDATTTYPSETTKQPDANGVPVDTESEKINGMLIDRYLSGFYVVLNIKTIFDPTVQGKQTFYTEFELGKMEWKEIDDLKITPDNKGV